MSAWPGLLGALAALLCVSGVDDLVPMLICAWHWFLRRENTYTEATPLPGFERRIAIFVPCWKEARVIGNMVRHNIAAIKYRNYDFFLGVYPNDSATVEAVRALAETFPCVHMALCPHPGPTSKADCLNWIYQRMIAREDEAGHEFDTVVLHDAEDMIHPDALPLINNERSHYAMVQVPVLPLPTPLTELTHAVYCDDFAEFQTVDMPARQFSGSFIPSSGVGTGFARDILKRLADERDGAVFNSASLTEDYEIGVYIHKAGFRQLFAPLVKQSTGFCATREYFPRRVKSAIRQRTRWVTGIALQSWARDGWNGSWCTRYWFWRDRKGLVASPLSFLTNLLFMVGLADWVAATLEHRVWTFAVSNSLVLTLCVVTTVLQILRLSARAAYTSHIYGLRFGLAVPLRSFHGNLINCCASFGAMWQYANARIHSRKLAWLKTEHVYPGRDSHAPTLRRLADVLASSHYISPEMLQRMDTRDGSDECLAEALLAEKLISDEQLCAAISVQSGVPFTRVDVRRINRYVARTLPRSMQERFSIVPFGLDSGRLFVAGVQTPRSEMYREIRQITPLPVEFHLVTQTNYKELCTLVSDEP